MARIQLSGLIADISGSIGGTSYQRSGNSHTARRKPVIRTTSNPLQQFIHNINSRVLFAWRNFAQDDLDAWAAYAAFRNKIKHKTFPTPQSGFMLFRSINFYLVAYGLDMILTPVNQTYDLDFTTPQAIETTPDYIVVFDRALVAANELLVIFMSRPVMISVNNPGSRLRMMIAPTANSDEWDYSTPYLSAFGTLPVAGDYIFAKYALLSRNTGFMYPFITSRVQVS